MIEENSLTKGPTLKTLLVFVVPFLIANVLQSLYGAIDLWVVGQYSEASSVAAVSTGTQVTQIITSLMTGLTLGSTILVGQYIGSKQSEQLKAAISTSLVLFFIVSCFITALMLLFEKELLALLNTPDSSFHETMQYITICSLGNIFICEYNAISSILRGYGDSKRPMYFVAISCLCNVFLDILFVKYFKMSVRGTAYATIISQAISMVIAIMYLKRKTNIFDFKLSSFKLDRYQVKRLASIGIPISFQELMVRISFLYLTMMMNRCGLYAAAIVGISSKFDVFAMLSATSMASALSAMTAQNMGAHQMKRANRSLYYGLSFALVIASCFFLWAQWSPETMIGLFSKDATVISTGIPFFKTCSYDYLFVTIVFCLNGYLNGREKTVWTMVSCSSGALLLRMPMVYYLSHHYPSQLGMLGCVAPIVSCIMAIYTLIYVLYLNKKDNTVIFPGE